MDKVELIEKLETRIYILGSTTYTMYDKGLYYGQGIMVYNFEEINQTNEIWIGHSGGTPDYNAILFYDVESQVIVALSINNATPATAIANALLQLLK